MSTNTRITAVLGVALLVVVGFIGYQQFGTDEDTGPIDGTATVPPELLVRDDSRYLSQAPDGKVTIVEFLDFECEACLAIYPTIEDLRATYGDRITFVVRYFPLPGHPNSMTAAKAVEAAAQQGAFEPMYKKMYETQTLWGHNDASQRDVFVGFARDLGLDIPAFEQAMDDPATEARIQRDIDDGTALSIGGTPTIFINGVETPPMPDREFLVSVIESALAVGSVPAGEAFVPLAGVSLDIMSRRFGEVA